VALLEASGAKVCLADADDELLGHADEQAREAIRTALGRTLGGELHSSYHVHLSRSSTGTLAVDITPDENPASVDGEPA
jgi:hypothetical protein